MFQPPQFCPPPRWPSGVWQTSHAFENIMENSQCVDPDAPPPPVEPKPNTSKSKLEVPQPKESSHSIEDLGDISSEFSVEVEELTDLTLDPAKKKGKFYRLVKSMKNRRKSVQVAKSADNLVDGKGPEEKQEKKKSFKFHRRFSLSRGRED